MGTQRRDKFRLVPQTEEEADKKEEWVDEKRLSKTKLVAVAVVCVIIAATILTVAGIITRHEPGSTETTHKIEFETIVDEDTLMVKGLFFSKQKRVMRATFHGGRSECNFEGTDVAALIDTHGSLVRTNMMHTPSVSSCLLDLRFLFRRFRRVVVSHRSIMFLNSGLDTDEGLACIRTPNSGRSLCETHEAGFVFHWFSTEHAFNENRNEFVVTAGNGQEQITIRPSSLISERVTEPLVDVVIPYILHDWDIHYDVETHRIAFRTRYPSLLSKQITAPLWFVVSVFFVVRLMKEDTYRVPAYHWTVLIICIATVVIALVSRSGSLASPWLQASTIVTLVVHLVIEAIRFTIHTRSQNQVSGVMQQIDIKPDMGVIMVAMITASYSFASHGLVVVPTFVILFYSVKTVSETVNARWIRGVSTAVLYTICLCIDIAYTLVLWHFIVWEFMDQTMIAAKYVQESVLVVITISGGIVVAHTRFRSTILPSIGRTSTSRSPG